MAQNKTILITGANGLLGERAVAQLSVGENTVYAVVRNVPTRKVAGVHYIVLDLAGNWSVQDLPTSIDTVIHLAQSSKFREFPQEALDVFNVNINTTARLLDFAYKNGAKRFVYASSGGVYGTGGSAFRENTLIYPRQDLGYYLGSKLCGEILCQNYTSHFDVSILRFFFLYGARQKRSMLLPRLVDSVREGRTIFLQGEEGISLNPVHVNDAAIALEKVLGVDGSHIVNIAGVNTYSLKRICSIIGDYLGCDPVYEVKDEEPQDLLADISFMKDEFYSPQISLEDGIKDLL